MRVGRLCLHSKSHFSPNRAQTLNTPRHFSLRACGAVIMMMMMMMMMMMSRRAQIYNNITRLHTRARAQADTAHTHTHTHLISLSAQTERHPQSAQTPAHTREERKGENRRKMMKKLSAVARASQSAHIECVQTYFTLVQSDRQSYDPEGWHGSAERIQIPPLGSAPLKRYHQFLPTG